MFAFLILLAFFGISCSGAKQEPAVKTVEAYIQALANKEAEKMVGLSCADWEKQARFELDSFVGVTTKAEGVSCQVSGTDGDATLVTCQGKIVANYGAENRDFDLNIHVYKVIQDQGEWRVCGYQ